MGGRSAEDFSTKTAVSNKTWKQEGGKISLRVNKKSVYLGYGSGLKNKMFFICLCAFLPENINTWVHHKASPVSGKGTQTN